MPGFKTGYIKLTRSDKTSTIAGSLTVAGTLTINGSMTFGDASVDTLAINGLTTVATNQKIQFRDTGLYINSGADGKLTISADGTGADDITLNGTVTAAGAITMQGGLDYTGITPSGTTPLIKAGTSSTALSSSTADTRFVQLYTKSTATSGDNRGIYNKLYLGGAGGGGESLRTFTTVDGVATGTAHGAHISLSFNATEGAGTGQGSLSGLGVAGRNTLMVPNNAAGCGTGTFAPIQAEIYGEGSASTIAPSSEFSFIRAIVDGATADVKATVDTGGFLMSVQGLSAGSAGSGKLFQTSITAATINAATTAALKVKVGATTYYIPLATATS